VVAKLFHASRPHVAVFGEKDFQQLTIIRRMNDDLDMGIDIIGLATVREADGLALSSRNRRLSPPQRAAAACVPRMLDTVVHLYRGGEVDATVLAEVGRDVVATEPLARFEHLVIVDGRTLLAVPIVDEHSVAVAAVWFGDVRLIDNRSLATP
jgi:pantoate--beta-alanine ligase